MPKDNSRQLNGRIKRRDVVRAGIVGGTIGVAGCQDLINDSDDGNPASDYSGEDIPDDALEGETISIGHLAPYPEDSDFGVGYDAVRAAELAIDEQNQAGGVLGAEVEQVVRDTNISPSTSRQRYRELVEEGVDFTMGCFLGQVLIQVLALSTQEEMLHLENYSAETISSDLTAENYDRYKYRFRFLTNVPQAIDQEIELIRQYSDVCGWDRAYVVNEDVQVFDPFNQLETRIEEETDMEVANFERTSTSVLDWSPLLDEAESMDVDIFMPHLVITGETLARQWSTQERPYQLGGIHIKGMVPTFWDAMDGRVEGLWTMNMATPDSHQTPNTIPFMDRYEEAYGYRSAVYPAYTTYDAVNILCHAIRQTGTLDDDVLVDYMEQMPPYTDSVLDEQFQFHGGDHDEYPHDMVHRDWTEQGWVAFNQWQEIDGNGRQVGFAPTTVAGAASPQDVIEEGRFVTPQWLPDL